MVGGRSTSPTGEPEGFRAVFVGYGIVAPSTTGTITKGRRPQDDRDARGDPPVPIRESAGSVRNIRRQGDDVTRPLDHKCELRRRGAAGAIIVHETGPAGYPFEVLRTATSARSSTWSRQRTWTARRSRPGTVDRARDILKMAGRTDELKARRDARLRRCPRRDGVDDAAQQAAPSIRVDREIEGRSETQR